MLQRLQTRLRGARRSALGGFLAFDQLLPAQGFLQVQAGGERPLHTFDDPASLYLYTAIGKSFNASMGFGRQWSPMVELTAQRDLANTALANIALANTALADTALAATAGTDWAVLPHFQVSLSARQHVRVDLGYLIPLNDTRRRPRQIMLYFLWACIPDLRSLPRLSQCPGGTRWRGRVRSASTGAPASFNGGFVVGGADALGAHSQLIGSLPEQVPYLEWQHSDFRNQQSCQSCHMPAITQAVPITRILGMLRTGARHHQFIAVNFLLQRMLGR